MSHDKVVAFCEPNKCKVEVSPKTVTDAFDSRITALEAGEFETVTADNLILPNGLTLSYNGYFEFSPDATYSEEVGFTFLSSPFLLNGVVSAKTSAVSSYAPYTPRLYIIGSNGLTKHILTTTQTEYTVTNAHTIFISWFGSYNDSYYPVITLGKPIIS